MKTDDPSPRGLRDLARRESGGLSSDARARVLAALHEEGPRVVRRARIQRQVTQVVSVVSGIALAVLGTWMLRGGTPSEPGPTELASGRPCDSRPVSSKVFQTAENGELLLDLGARAFVRAEPGSIVRVEENQACRLVLSLEQGRVDVHARDLGAGELEVLTAEGRIHVRGTIFSVARAEGELTVDVAEGVVEVASPEEGKQSVRRGERLKRVRRKAERSGLEEAEELRLLLAVRAVELDESEDHEEEIAAVDEIEDPKPRRAVRKKRRWKRRAVPREVVIVESAPDPTPEIPPVVAAPEPPPETLDDLLSDAERLKRAGDLSGARRALRRAGEMPGPDARAAWIALARLELQDGKTADVRRAVGEYRRRGGGPLEPEGSWLLVRAEERAGRAEEARAEAAALLSRWPSTPQAEEARRWIQRADAGASP